MNQPKIKILDGEYSDEFYWKRVNRSLMWLGVTEEEQLASQRKLSSAVVGVAGCGGIGGALALRLARLGVRHIKVSDPDVFDISNLNRQLGATRHTLGKNKAEVVGASVHDLAGDVTVEIYPEGIKPHTAGSFVEGCDLVFDQMDFYLVRDRYALHRAFRASEKTKCILSAWCVGWGTSLFKYTKDGMTIEDYFGIPEDAIISPGTIKALLPKFLPKNPRFPSMEMLDEWLIEKRAVPLFAGTPPVAEGAAIQRAALILTGLEKEPYATVLPSVPSYYVYDGSTFEGQLVENPAVALKEFALA